jgi:hypothetical protein
MEASAPGETAAGFWGEPEPTAPANRLVVPGLQQPWLQLRDRLVTRRGLIAAAVLLASGLLYWYLTWILSSTSVNNSDSANIALQGWDLWHHNPKLRNWITGDANFYTFETPLNAVVEWVMGLSATMMHVVSALIYTLVMLTAAWLAKGEETGMRAYVRFGVVAAFLTFPLFEQGLTGSLLESPDHIGTMVFVMGAYLLCDRAAGRKGATWCLFVLLVLGQLGDATVKYVAVLPIVVVCVSRSLFARRLNAPELWMAFAAAASVFGEATVRAALRTWGAYSMVAPKTALAPSRVWLDHLRLTVTGLLTLFRIPTTGSAAHGSFWVVGAALGAVVLIAAGYGFVRTLARWPRAAAADQLLTVGIPVYLAAYAFSTIAASGGAYEFIGVVALIVVLGARNVPLPEPRRLPLAAAVAGLTAVAVLATGFAPGVVSPQEKVAAWLKAHGLTYGLGGYWDAASTTVDSGNAVAVRSVVQNGDGRYGVYAWVTNLSWYDPAKHNAQFFIANPTVPGQRPADVEAAYGAPAAVYQVADKEILVYRKNLLATLIQAKPPNF